MHWFFLYASSPFCVLFIFLSHCDCHQISTWEGDKHKHTHTHTQIERDSRTIAQAQSQMKSRQSKYILRFCVIKIDWQQQRQQRQGVPPDDTSYYPRIFLWSQHWAYLLRIRRMGLLLTLAFNSIAVELNLPLPYFIHDFECEWVCVSECVGVSVWVCLSILCYCVCVWIAFFMLNSVDTFYVRFPSFPKLKLPKYPVEKSEVRCACIFFDC